MDFNTITHTIKEEQIELKLRYQPITPSGIFSNRAERHLLKHSGLIQFDIDYKEKLSA